MDKYNFQYCQKIVVFSKDGPSVLLCKRKGEADYDGVFSFIGGKKETTDKSIIEGLKREKDEEVGKDFKIRIYSRFTTNVFFTKKDGSAMILPHYLALHLGGKVRLNNEYSEYKWVKLDEVDKFEPKIPNIPDILRQLLKLKTIAKESEFEII